MIRRVAIYARVSTKRQAGEGYSIEDQQRRLEAIAAARGWDVVERYVDAGRSGRTVAGREQFQSMLEAADRHAFDAVLVQHRDRWARNYIEAGIAHDRLERLGIAVLDEDGAGDSDRALERSPERRLMRGTKDVYADYFSDLLGSKTSNGIRRKALMGLHWGDVPFGYRRPNKKEPMVIEESEAVAIRAVFERYSTGRHSMADLARWVNAHGFRTHNKRSPEPGLFTNSSIRVILDNPLYVGELVVDGQRIAARHPAIVSAELFEQAAHTRATERHRRPAKVEGRVYLVGGMARHSECGEPLWASSIGKSGTPVYRCSHRQRGGAVRCERMTRESSLVDADVSQLFEQLVLPAEWRVEVAAMFEQQMSEQKSEDEIARERQRLEGRLRRLQQALVDELLPYDKAAREIRETEAELSALAPAFVPSRTAQAGTALTSIHELWPHMLPSERQETVRLVLEWVRVDLRDASLVAFKPRPDFVPLFATVAAAGGAVANIDAEESVHWWTRGGSAAPPAHIFIPSWRAA